VSTPQKDSLNEVVSSGLAFSKNIPGRVDNDDDVDREEAKELPEACDPGPKIRIRIRRR
tara:strand:+ start:1938 stop:2114 length:177 start_codon:yes stop_codon:yes gene_type:complete